MRIRIVHDTTFVYTPPARTLIYNLRLTPRSFDAQYVLRWRVTTDIDGTLRHAEDSLGNIVHSFSYTKPVERFSVSAIGEVETSDAVGVVRGAVETLPVSMFLRSSPLAQTNGALRDFGSAAIAGVTDPLERLHSIMGALHEAIALDRDKVTGLREPGEALALKRGAPADIAHAFIALARWMEIPARFVSGYVASDEGESNVGLFAWAEAYAPNLGWVAFDPVHDLCPGPDYVRLAVGFDSQGAAPHRGTFTGAFEESVKAAVRIDQSNKQSQN